MAPHLNMHKQRQALISQTLLKGRLMPCNLLDSINLIRDSGYWSERFDAVMNQWFNTYLTFLTGVKGATMQRKKTDRNGSWHYLQTNALAWYLGDEKVLSRQIKFTKGMMKNQFDKKGESFWNYPCVDEGELERGINYLMPFVRSEAWPPYPSKGVRPIGFVHVLGRYTDHAGLQEHKVLLKGLLTEAQKGADGENYETRVINTFALFPPCAFGS